MLILQAHRLHSNLKNVILCQLQAKQEKSTAQHLVRACVLDNLGAQVGALDCSKVLLVRFAVAGVFVQHVRRSCLDLRFDDGVPQLLRLNGLSGPAFLLVP